MTRQNQQKFFQDVTTCYHVSHSIILLNGVLVICGNSVFRSFVLGDATQSQAIKPFTSIMNSFQWKYCLSYVLVQHFKLRLIKAVHVCGLTYTEYK